MFLVRANDYLTNEELIISQLQMISLAFFIEFPCAVYYSLRDLTLLFWICTLISSLLQ